MILANIAVRAQRGELQNLLRIVDAQKVCNETLLTERAYAAVCDRDVVHFEAQDQDEQMFPFYRATRF